MNDGKKLRRRLEDNLHICGLGVIILGAWNVLKVLLQVALGFKDVFNSGFVEETWEVAVLAVVITIAVLLLICFLLFWVHFYIGRNASKAAKGLPYKKGYYVWAIIILVISILSMYGYIYEFQDLRNIDTVVASIIVDITLIYVLFGVISSTRKLRSMGTV